LQSLLSKDNDVESALSQRLDKMNPAEHGIDKNTYDAISLLLLENKS